MEALFAVLVGFLVVYGVYAITMLIFFIVIMAFAIWFLIKVVRELSSDPHKDTKRRN